MSRRPADRFAAAAFVASVAVLALLYGVLAGRFDWFPNPQIAMAEGAVRDLAKHWRNDLGLEPTRHLAPARQSGRAPEDDGFRRRGAGAADGGFVLIAGVDPDPDSSFHAIALYDGEGRRLHRWPVRYERLDPDGAKPQNVMLHGMEVLDDGSVVVAFDSGAVIARLDACGEPLWATRGRFHHSITPDDDGDLWTWLGDDIAQIDPGTGEVKRVLELRSGIMRAAGGQAGVFAIRSITEDAGEMRFEDDPFHANDVEPLTANMAEAFPMFSAGDLLISLREINLVAVISPEDGRLLWHRHGPWHRQHDPDFQPDGTITVLDNGTGSERSRILRIDPATNRVSEAFAPSDAAPFYTWRRGKHQFLPNGDVLVTESERGCVFQAAPDGSLVWEREMPWDASRNVIVTEARHVPPDHFRNGPPRCGR